MKIAKHVFPYQQWFSRIVIAIALWGAGLLGIETPVYHYSVDLTRIVDDRFEVKLSCAEFASDKVIFYFPKIVPGTYQISDFGRYIKNFKAYDQLDKILPVAHPDCNTFIIEQSSRLSSISYWVDDTWDARPAGGGRHKPWPMSGTNTQASRSYIWNAGGVFGFFAGQLDVPVEIEVNLPENFYGVTALPQVKISNNTYLFKASNYRQLIDSPIMFTPPDTLSLTVKNTKILIGAAHESDSSHLVQRLQPSLSTAVEAVVTFLDTLPTDHYTFIYYFTDEHRLGGIVTQKHFVILKMLAYFIKNGLPVGGGLEHRQSSFYTLPDLGPNYFDRLCQLNSEIAIHEFMHIITPLGLHSELIGEIDFITPKMSKHLWLYEGVTEYFAQLIRVRSRLISPQDFLFKVMRSKIKSGERFPNEKMSFTEMSANVLKKKYQVQFLQVYQRGAAMAMLLDLEIIRLTNGKKCLADVILELARKYSPDNSFNEETFIDEFVDLVHPDLRQFFTKFVEGRAELPYADILKTVGIEYLPRLKERCPRHYVADNDVKRQLGIIDDFTQITHVGKRDFVGFKEGDIVNMNLYHQLYLDSLGNYIPEYSTVTLPVIRQKQTVYLPFKVKYIEKTTQYRLRFFPERTAEQRFYYHIWLDGRKPVGI